jgi:hypothetical protein
MSIRQQGQHFSIGVARAAVQMKHLRISPQGQLVEQWLAKEGHVPGHHEGLEDGHL